MKLCRLQFLLSVFCLSAAAFLLIKAPIANAYTELDSLAGYPITGLSSYWKLENTADSYGALTLYNGGTTTFTTGLFNNAADFGSTNSSKYLYSTSNNGVASNGSISFSFWVNMAEPTNNGTFQRAFQSASTGANGAYLGLGFYQASGISYIRMDRQTPNVGYDYQNVAISDTSFIWSEWNHVALTYDGTNMRIYVNGVLEGTPQAASGNSSGGFYGYQTIGSGWEWDLSVKEYFSGKIDDFSYYAATLTAENIAAISESFEPLAITSQIYATSTKNVLLSGTCQISGSGTQQLAVYHDSLPSGYGTPTDPMDDCWRVGSGSSTFNCIIPCLSDNTFITEFHGFGLTGTSTIYIDDQFYGSQVASTTQAWSTSTPDWEFSYGYTSRDDPEGTAARVACSDEDWASQNWWTEFKCEIAKLYWSTYFNARNSVMDELSGNTSAMGNLFPFNFSTAINDSWEESASSTLPTGLEFLGTISSSTKNVDIPIYSGLAGNTTTTATILGSGIWGTSTPIMTSINSIRLVSTYVFWGLYFLWLYFKAKEFYEHLIL